MSEGNKTLYISGQGIGRLSLLYTIIGLFLSMLNPEITQTRTPTQEINPVFVNRWSPRGMTGEELDEDDLMALFEAARWAPLYIIINLGGSFMRKETPKAGKNSLACWLRAIKCGLRISSSRHHYISQKL